MIIGFQPIQKNSAWSSLYGYRSFRGAGFYGEAPKPNTTYFCAEQTDNCMECLSCAAAQFPNNPGRRKGSERRCRRKYSASSCAGGPPSVEPPAGCGVCPDGYECKDNRCQPKAPPGAEMCPMVCVPDGTGVTCNYNCMGVTTNIINTGTPGEVIPVSTVKSWFNASSWLSHSGAGSSYLPTGAGTYYPPSDSGDGGIIDTVTSNWTTILLVGGGGFLLWKVLKK